MDENMNVPQDDKIKQELLKNIKALREEIDIERHLKMPRNEVWTQEALEITPPNRHELKLKGTFSLKDEGNCGAVCFGRTNNVFAMTLGAFSTGNSVVWDSQSRTRKYFVRMESCWQVDADFDKQNGNLIAAGGLEENVNVFNLGTEVVINQPTFSKPNAGIVNSTLFLTSDNLLASSGNKIKQYSTVNDLQTTTIYEGHTGDVFCMAVNPIERDVFISGASDFTARVWDVRVHAQSDNQRSGNTFTYDVRSREVNSLAYFPDGICFGAALNNCDIHLYDNRACCKLLTLRDNRTYGKFPAEKIKFSTSGRLCFAVYKGGSALVYDLLSQTVKGELDHPMIEGAAQFLPKRGDLVQDIDIDPGNSTLAMGYHKDTNRSCYVSLYWPSKR